MSWQTRPCIWPVAGMMFEGSRIGLVLLAVLVAVRLSIAPVLAEDRRDPPLVGVLRLDTPETIGQVRAIFLNGLEARGYVDGRDVRVRF